MGSAVVCLALLVLWGVTTDGFYFEDGYDHHYTYSSQSDMLGMHNITTVIKFRVRAVNRTAEGSLNLMILDSFVQHSDQGYVADNPKKWDLSKRFFFTVMSDGLVTLVHFHPEEKDEVLSLKKVLASTFSAKVQISSGSKWTFTSKEVDHAGDLEHSYDGEKTNNGYRVSKTHRSSKEVHRAHDKTVTFDDGGTPLHVSSFDNITLRRAEPEAKREPIEGEHVINDYFSGEFPLISSVSHSMVSLTTKRLHLDPTPPPPGNEMTSSTLEIHQKKPEPVAFEEVEDNVELLLACIHAAPTPHHRNRTQCTNELRKTLYTLVRSEFLQLLKHTVERRCNATDSKCVDERELFMDILAGDGNLDAQLLMLDSVMQSPDVTEDDLRRCLFHTVAYSHPIREVVVAVEELCFGKNNSHHGSTNMPKTRKRACLAIGAMAKPMATHNTSEAHRIVEKLETWLEHHNETKSMAIIKPRMKRSVTEYDFKARKHVETKMVLLKCLGNAGMTRSLSYLKSYMEPNIGVLTWRRAAIHSLKHFTCNESATMLLTSVVHDNEKVVRITAKKMYDDHPKSYSLSPEQEEIIMRKHYIYPVVSRVKRGLKEIMQMLIDGIRVHIEPPGIEWDKSIGTHTIGVNFGLHIRNILDLHIGLLSGHFRVDVLDEAFAIAHFQLLNIRVDIVKARVCFNGHIEYDLNVLKDFGINSIQDLVHIYDKVVGNVVDPIKRAVDGFKKVVQLFGGQNLLTTFKKIVQTVKNLPQIMGQVTRLVGDFFKYLASLAVSAVVETIKSIVQSIRGFVDGIKQDVLKFYHSIVDPVVMGLPYIGKKIVDAFHLLVDAFKNILKNPMQSITSMVKAVSDVKMAVSTVVDIKNKVIKACMFIKGRVSAWIATAKTVPKIIGQLKDAFKKMAEDFKKRRRLPKLPHNPFSDEFEVAKDSLHDVEEELIQRWEKIIHPVMDIAAIAKPFVTEFKAIVDVIKALKKSYKEVKTFIEQGKSKIQKVFGPKFHLKFPTQRRSEGKGCKAGTFPTTTNGRYKTEGVDLVLGAKQSIPAPVDGIVHWKENHVLFQPTAVEFKEMEIIIHDIDRLPNSNGKRFSAGKKIGKAKKVGICKTNFIHVAVRQKLNQTKDDEEYDYMDPSVYLDRLVPVPKWIQECNDHEFTYIGQTTEAEETADGEPETLRQKLERKVNENMDTFNNDFDSMVNEASQPYTPDDPSLTDETSFGDSLKNSLKEQSKQFMNFFATALFGKNGPKIPNLLDIINMINKTVDYIVDKLDNDPRVKAELLDVIDQMCEKMMSLPADLPTTMPISHSRQLLSASRHGDEAGDATSVTVRVMQLSEEECPGFKSGIVGENLCKANNDCTGITCNAVLPIGTKAEVFRFSVQTDIPSNEIVVTLETRAERVPLDGEDVEFQLLQNESRYHLVVNGRIDSDSVVVSVEVRVCQGVYGCVPLEILNDISLKKIHQTTVATTLAAPIRCPKQQEIYAMSIPKFLNTLAEYDLLDRNVLKVLDDVRAAVVKELLKEALQKFETAAQEFKDKLDFCLDANVPAPKYHVSFFPPMHFLFMAGPIPFQLSFGAGGSVGLGVKLGMCVLSMKLKVTLTPWVGGQVWGAMGINLGFASGGIKFTGYIIETKFPITGEVTFSKYPIQLGARMDLLLTPVRFRLSAYAKLHLLFVDVTVFDASIWQYKAPTISKNIFNKIKKDEDKSPPDLVAKTVNTRRKREGTKGCTVEQLRGRSPHDTAFKLEMYAQDAVSDVKLFYAIGTHRGGNNVVDWTDMGGSSLIVPCSLPGGIPLYWTVKAKNSQGLATTTQCFLKTFDNTLPDGRIEHSYKFSSHPSKLQATAVAIEDSPLVDNHYAAVGYSAGKYGSEFVDWHSMSLDHTTERHSGTGVLRRFTIPREGKLVAGILKSTKTTDAERCAQTCISFGDNCVSFDYEYHSETCDLHDVVEGSNAFRRISGTYSNYERLGIGYYALLDYTDLDLKHGTVYFLNARVENTLGYEGFLVGAGTMVDFTPPEPGPIGKYLKDELRADNCTAAITQQCIDVTWKENHRIIVDGLGSSTIFNGHEPLIDQKYTLTNHYVSANWHGFHDDESGIWGYTWAVGRDVCGTDVLPFNDPYSQLSSKKFWTDSGFHKGVHLDDGSYYVSVQALNSAQLGGSLVTTVCHSTPFKVDTTPPVFGGVTDIIYDEDFDLIAIYYNASDDLSKIAKAEFGLGETKYDVKLRPYSEHGPMERDDPFVSVEDLGLVPGKPAWIRIRVTNNVDLFTSGNGNEPILIDRSQPVKGQVLDGSSLQKDLKYQSDNKHICAQWIDFFDPESGISRFLWGVGTKPGLDDVVPFHNMTQYEKSGCEKVPLMHNHTYYSTVFAFNSALNSKSTNNTSDGVLVDTTPPIAGYVKDGNPGKDDMKYTSETVSKQCNWDGFHDPESGIEKYEVDVFVNNELKETFETGASKSFEDKTISMEHHDKVKFTIHGVNGAGLQVTSQSDGFIVDQTPPIMTKISDSLDGLSYQSFSDKLNIEWKFEDEDSGISEYRTTIYESMSGIKHKVWPSGTNKYNVSRPAIRSSAHSKVTLPLSLQSGAMYSLQVTALNGALLATSHESSGVTVDTTPPPRPKIHIGLMKDEEERENGRILHDDQNGIRVSWTGSDPESGIKDYLVAIGTSFNTTSMLDFTSFGQQTTAYINNIHFDPSSAEPHVYYKVSMKSINGAGLVSDVEETDDIYVQKANVPGVVFDGRSLFQDEVYTTDSTSIAVSFYGFESESCNIEGFDWAIGTTAYGTDVLSYTDYGLVMMNDTHGYAQIHTEIYEDTIYFATVRARTACKDQYILSSSDGIILDKTAPAVNFHIHNNGDKVVIQDGVIYQAFTDSLAVVPNATDSEEIAYVSLAIGDVPFPELDDLVFDDYTTMTDDLVLDQGSSAFLKINMSDKAGNANITASVAIISDVTPPVLKNVKCTKYISYLQSVMTCTWDKVEEEESILDYVGISFGSTPQAGDILDGYKLPGRQLAFTRDLQGHLHPNQTSLYVDIKVLNILGIQNDYEEKVIVDITPPVVGEVLVVTSTSEKIPDQHQKCQLPRSYIEVRMKELKDEESAIDEMRYEVAVGSSKHVVDILSFTKVQPDEHGLFFVNGFDIKPGQHFYVTLRVYNKAGLYSDGSSEGTVVSQSPTLNVIDGSKATDVDFQHLPNVIQGRWEYSDDCPIRDAQWAIHTLTGTVVQDFRAILGAANSFFNDEIQLQNGIKYINVIRTLDFLNRTKISTSDGVTVRIQPPYPGRVRDGDDEDLNYQYLTTSLSANWDNFGDESDNPTQAIHHYEVAIGNDRRYERTRTNVHFFVDVGLNTSYTFQHLNLTAKTVRYYITVRAYSVAGSYAEGYSNGIRVGYRETIKAGLVETKHFQSSTNSVSISWTGFESDIGIIQYLVGVSGHESEIRNDTFECSFLFGNQTFFDVFPLKKIGLDEFVELTELKLQHGATYYATVVAEDESGMCTASTGDRIYVDTTLPRMGTVFVNGLASTNVLYATSSSEMHTSWVNFTDPESDIGEVVVSLYECRTCQQKTLQPSDGCFLLAERTMQGDTEASFFELQMNSRNAYYVQLNVYNRAGLSRTIRTSTILLDESAPRPGKVKIGETWDSQKNFQFSATAINGFLAIASTLESYDCRNQKRYFPTESIDNMWDTLDGNFLPTYQKLTSDGAVLGLGYDTSLTDITQSGIISKRLDLSAGNYTFRIKSASGFKTLTSFGLMTSGKLIPSSLTNKPVETEFDLSAFENVTGLVAPNDTIADNETSTEANATAEIPAVDESSATLNETAEKIDTSKFVNEYGFGVHLLGYKVPGNKYYHHMFWVKNEFADVQRWFTTEFNPFESVHDFTFNIKRQKDTLDERWDLSFLLDDVEVLSTNGIQLNENMKLAALTWNEDNYRPEITNLFHPFYTEALLKSIDIPDDEVKECQNGKGFYDGESGIKEVWVAVSDSPEVFDNVAPQTLIEEFCYPCLKPCTELCKLTCYHKKIDDDFTIIPINIGGLTLQPVDIHSSCLNASSSEDESCNGTNYYLKAKVINFAGESTIVSSNAVQVDITEPVCEYMRCLDPDYSEDEPIDHLGSSSRIGAYWSCKEDTSEIKAYTISVINLSDNTVVMKERNVGLKTKSMFSLGIGTFEEGKQYSVEVAAINSAGLKSKYNCSVRVNLYPPDVSKTITGSTFASETGESTVLETTFRNKVDITWSGGSNDTQFYEWQLGTSPEDEDIFPVVKVGMNTSGSASIASGKLNLGTQPVNRSLAEFQPGVMNKSQEELRKLKDLRRKENTFFFMEPGRCVYQTLYAKGWSHLRSKVQEKVICIRRHGDIKMKRKHPGEIIEISKRLSEDRWVNSNRATSTQPDVHITAKGLDGEVLVGSLTEDDKQQDYGSAASSSFVPFIVSPAVTKSQTTRMLHERLETFCNVSFYLSPEANVSFTNLLLNVSIPPFCQHKEGAIPALVYWDTGIRRWALTDSGCGGSQIMRYERNRRSSEFCPTSSSARVRRDTSLRVMTSPAHVELVNIKTNFSNHRPTITTNTLSAVEDQMLNISADITHDSDNDTLRMDITGQPSHGHCNKTGLNDSSWSCQFDKDFYGADTIKITVSEYGLPTPFPPNVVTNDIKVIITGQNDPPSLYFIDRSGVIHHTVREVRLDINIDANDTDALHAGYILLTDVDGGDAFDMTTKFIPLDNCSKLSLQPTDVNIFANFSASRPSIRTLEAYSVEVKFDPGSNGEMIYNFRAKDTSGKYTSSLILYIYLLINPCVYGVCSHSTLGQEGCDNQARASSFSEYECKCTPGYTDQWCQTEINECKPEPCALMFDCEDLINGYRCNINIPKLMAILLCSFIAIACVIFLTVRLVKRYKNNKVGMSSVSLMNDAIQTTVSKPGPGQLRELTIGSIILESNSRPASAASVKPSSPPPRNEDTEKVNKSEDSGLELFSVFAKTRAGMLPPLHHAQAKKRKQASVTVTAMALEDKLDQQAPSTCSTVKGGQLSFTEAENCSMADIEI